MNKKYTGFIAPIITQDNFVLGGLGVPLPVINPSGDWTPYLPTFESQLQTYFDSFGCTVYGTLNAVETLNKFLTNIEENYSDRFTYNAVGISPPGGDPHIVATTIRGSGLLFETDLSSLASSLAEFATPRPLPIDLRVKAQKWLNKQMLGHQWIWTSQPDTKTRIELLKDALTKGTVCISVDAWYQNDQGLYYSPNKLNGHWTFIYKIDDTGIYCFDSYNDAKINTNLKKLTLDHNIQFAKVYFFTKPTQQQNWFIELITSLLSVVGLYEKQVEVVKPVDKPISPQPQQVYNEVKESMKKNLLDEFCLAIRDFEGKPGDLNYRNNNPGNIRGVDGKFLKFKTMEEGMAYLKDYVTRACTGKHKAYSPKFTIIDFFNVYAPTGDNNNPGQYAKWVANRIGVDVSFKIQNLL